MVERVGRIAFVVSFGGEGGPAYVRWDYRRRLTRAHQMTSARDYIDEVGAREPGVRG